MGTGNYTTVMEFIILGLAEDTTACAILFTVFLGIHVVTLMGNVSKKQPSASYPKVPFPLPFGLCRHWVLHQSHLSCSWASSGKEPLSVLLVVSLSSVLRSHLGWLSASCWLPWPMTAMWPSACPCSTPPTCPPEPAFS